MYNRTQNHYNKRDKNLREDKKDISFDLLLYFLLGYDVLKQYDVTDSQLFSMLFEVNKVDKIPQEILINKFIEYLIFKGYSDDEITKFFTDNVIGKSGNSFCISFTQTTIEKQVRDILDKLKDKNIIFEELTSDIIEERSASINLYKNEIDSYADIKKHEGQPPPNPKLGRPRMDWKICAHQSCSHCFESKSALSQHLDNMKCHTKGYHYYHEKLVEELDLTEEKVLQEKINKCPAFICKQKINTPIELVKHLKELGIKPFFKEGDFTINTKKVELDKFTDIKKMYEYNDLCISCCENEPEILFYDCGHMLICSKCHDKHKVKKCYLCKKESKYIFPYKKINT